MGWTTHCERAYTTEGTQDLSWYHAWPAISTVWDVAATPIFKSIAFV